MIDRRAFLRAGLAVAAAPFIVRASSLMALPVRKPQQVWAMQHPALGEYLIQFWPPTPQPVAHIWDGVKWVKLRLAAT